MLLARHGKPPYTGGLRLCGASSFLDAPGRGLLRRLCRFLGVEWLLAAGDLERQGFRIYEAQKLYVGKTRVRITVTDRLVRVMDAEGVSERLLVSVLLHDVHASARMVQGAVSRNTLS